MPPNLDGKPTISEEMLLANFAASIVDGYVAHCGNVDVRDLPERIYHLAKALLRQHKKEIGKL